MRTAVAIVAFLCVAAGSVAVALEVYDMHKTPCERLNELCLEARAVGDVGTVLKCSFVTLLTTPGQRTQAMCEDVLVELQK